MKYLFIFVFAFSVLTSGTVLASESSDSGCSSLQGAGLLSNCNQ
jgi:hypothetical protein